MDAPKLTAKNLLLVLRRNIILIVIIKADLPNGNHLFRGSPAPQLFLQGIIVGFAVRRMHADNSINIFILPGKSHRLGRGLFIAADNVYPLHPGGKGSLKGSGSILGKGIVIQMGMGIIKLQTQWTEPPSAMASTVINSKESPFSAQRSMP